MIPPHPQGLVRMSRHARLLLAAAIIHTWGNTAFSRHYTGLLKDCQRSVRANSACARTRMEGEEDLLWRLQEIRVLLIVVVVGVGTGLALSIMMDTLDLWVDFYSIMFMVVGIQHLCVEALWQVHWRKPWSVLGIILLVITSSPSLFFIGLNLTYVL